MTFAITATKRESGHAEDIRAAGEIPAVLYGPQVASTSLTLDYQTFDKLYQEAGESSLIDVSVEGDSAPIKALIQDVQYDPIKDRFIHVDFRQINMDKEMHATVELSFVGEPAAVKTLGGTLLRQREDVEVKCLPKDLVNHIDVDLTVLATFDNAIHIKDLPVPSGITILDDPEALVAKVSAPLSEEQLKAMEESQVGDVEAVEVTKEKKEGEGEEVAEGAAKSEKKEESGS